MGNLLRFPFNAWDLARTLSQNLTQGGGTDPTPSDNLLGALAVLRECLDSAGSSMSDDLVLRCKAATQTALTAAIGTERTLHHQSLRIAEMEHLASTDPLTSAYNRRGFQQEFERILAAAGRYLETGVLIYVDLDGFKPINDTYGHAAGDRVLCEVAGALHKNIRPHDLVARLGGDEFAVLLTRTDWKNGLKRAEFLKHTLNTLDVTWQDKHIAVRASFGCQRFGPEDCHKTLLIKADRAMYEAKRIRAATPEN